MRQVLVTGAVGRIGSTFRVYAAERYDLRLADRLTDGPGAAVSTISL